MSSVVINQQNDNMLPKNLFCVDQKICVNWENKKKYLTLKYSDWKNSLFYLIINVNWVRVNQREF